LIKRELPLVANALEFVAHRGASADAPENTLAAIELAWRQGADAVEADFRLTRDGHVVALHDHSLERMAGVDLQVAQSTLEELRQFEIGRASAPHGPDSTEPSSVLQNSPFAAQRIPTLAELLATMPPGKRFYVELKCGAEIADLLTRTVKASAVAEEQIALICFSADVLVELRRSLPRSPTYLVVEFLRDPQSGQWHPDAFESLAEAQRHRLSGLDLMAARVDAELLRRVRDAGLDICVWTVDSPDEARRLIDLGVRRITTNRPGWLRRQLAL
jgi:glycerophosphoryl diester phosphodiesterase